jgi:hypothetical protein
MRGSALALGLLVALGLVAAACSDDDDSGPPDWNVGTLVRWVDDGLLAELDAPYGTLRIVRVQGSHYDMGYQYAYLLHAEIQGIWDNIFGPLIGEEFGMDPELAIDIFNGIMDQAWNHTLPHTSQDFLDELEGARDGAEDAGHADPDGLVDILRRVMMLVDTSQANEFGGDVGTMTRFFTNGYSAGFAAFYGLASAADPMDGESFAEREAIEGRFAPPHLVEQLMQRFAVPSCSFFAAWGPRTVDGRQIASRVLDFSADIGLVDYALVTVFVPEGGAAYATIGYVGMLSTFAGMNEHGLALSAVGSSSAVDRLNTQSISMKAREALEFAEDLDDGLPMLTGSLEDGVTRAPSVGTVAMLAWGDPTGGGAMAEAAATEFNGAYASLYRFGASPACGEAAYLFEYDVSGQLSAEYNHVDHPDMANLEEDAYEIGKDGAIRTFLVDQNQEFVYDATSGELIDDPDGLPYRVGYPLPCAVFRADPAMNFLVRRYQVASNGPARDSTRILMHLAGAYKNRHIPQYYMLDAYERGVAFEWEGVEVIPSSGQVPRPIGVEEAKNIISVVAMDQANTFNAIYDTTNLVIYVAYESGRGAAWTKAADNEYVELRLADLLPANR